LNKYYFSKNFNIYQQQTILILFYKIIRYLNDNELIGPIPDISELNNIINGNR